MLLEELKGVEVQVITSLPALTALEDEWKRLWRECPRAGPFQTPEWLFAWWRCFGNGKLHVLALRTEGRLAALLPGYQLDGSLQFLGIGVSDHLDALIAPGFEEAAVSALLDHITDPRVPWHACQFQQLSAESPLLRRPGGGERRGWYDQISAQDVCPTLVYPPRIEEWAARLSPRHLRNLRYSRRLAEKEGARIETADEGSFEELFAALVSLHSRRWNERGERGAFADPAAKAFHQLAAAGLLAAGMLRLYALRLGERIAAALYGFIAKRRFCYYLSGFDSAVGRLSLGSLLVEHAIREAFSEGALEFDFLRGREPYKYQWGAEDRENFSRRLIRAAWTDA